MLTIGDQFAGTPRAIVSALYVHANCVNCVCKIVVSREAARPHELNEVRFAGLKISVRNSAWRSQTRKALSTSLSQYSAICWICRSR
jgi:hypothetical protein